MAGRRATDTRGHGAKLSLGTGKTVGPRRALTLVKGLLRFIRGRRYGRTRRRGLGSNGVRQRDANQARRDSASERSHPLPALEREREVRLLRHRTAADARRLESHRFHHALHH